MQRLKEKAAAAGLVLTQAELNQLEAIAGRSAWAGDRTAFAAARASSRGTGQIRSGQVPVPPGPVA